MLTNVKIMVQEMNQQWQIIVQSLNKKQIKDNEYAIDLITKNLATIEAIENKTINKIEWYDYIKLAEQIYDEIYDLINCLSEDYLSNDGATLYNFKKNIASFLSDEFEVKLKELSNKFNELSISDQSQVRNLEYEIWVVKRTIQNFLNFSKDVGVVNEDVLKTANCNHSEILANLAELKLMLVGQELGIYNSEHFFVHDMGDRKIKPN